MVFAIRRPAWRKRRVFDLVQEHGLDQRTRRCRETSNFLAAGLQVIE